MPSSTMSLLTFRMSLVQFSPRRKWPGLKAWLSIFSVVKLFIKIVGQMVWGTTVKCQQKIHQRQQHDKNHYCRCFVIYNAISSWLYKIPSSKMIGQRPPFYYPLKYIYICESVIHFSAELKKKWYSGRYQKMEGWNEDQWRREVGCLLR